MSFVSTSAATADPNAGILPTVPDYGGAFAAWRAATEDEWEAYIDHAFVRQLRDGTLPRTQFLRYLRQDYLYLKHYGRAWALGTIKAETSEEMAACATTTHKLLVEERALHLGICARAGISRADIEAEREEIETVAYTRYVLDAGHSGDFLDLMAAVAPCLWGYGEIGARLAASDHSPEYAEWIGVYGGEDFQDACRRGGAMIETALVRRLGPDYTSSPRWPSLTERFRTASELEAAFWSMGLRP